MRLPAAAAAIVVPAKVRDYLLAPEHPLGRSKARFFESLGFERRHWELLQEALLAVARTGNVSHGSTSPYGQKYLVDAMLQGPNGRHAAVRTVWLVLRGEQRPRFVTAFPMW